MPLFSIIVPTYNRSESLRATIESVGNQTFEDYELIVVDDGSTDDTAAVVEKIAQDFPELLYIRQPNSGQAVARNAGISSARGEYVAFLDSDDLWFPWTLSTIAMLIEFHEKPSALIGRAVDFRRIEELEAVSQSALAYERYDDLFDMPPETAWLGTTACIFRTDLLRRCAGFVTKRMNFEDLDLWLRIGTSRDVIRIEAPFTVGYRRHEGAVTGSTSLSLAGVYHVLASEQAGLYAGGDERKPQRSRYVTRLARSISVGLARRGWPGPAFGIYSRSWMANAREGRVRYLAALPFLAVAGAFKGRWRIGRP